MNVFERLTAGCEKDCRIRVGMRSTMLKPVALLYDKHGVPVNDVDPNATITRFSCVICGYGWVVLETPDKDPIIEKLRLNQCGS